MEEITGTLENWCVDKVYPNIIWGNLFGDTKKRWREGQRIHTSNVVTDPVEWKEGNLIETLNSTYYLGKKIGETE